MEILLNLNLGGNAESLRPMCMGEDSFFVFVGTGVPTVRSDPHSRKYVINSKEIYFAFSSGRRRTARGG